MWWIIHPLSCWLSLWSLRGKICCCCYPISCHFLFHWACPLVVRPNMFHNSLTYFQLSCTCMYESSTAVVFKSWDEFLQILFWRSMILVMIYYNFITSNVAFWLLKLNIDHWIETWPDHTYCRIKAYHITKVHCEHGIVVAMFKGLRYLENPFLLLGVRSLSS